MPQKRILSYLMSILAFIFWGTTFPFGKTVSPHPLSPLTIVFLRTLIGSIALFLVILLNKQFHEWKAQFLKRFWAYLFGGIVLYALTFLMEYWSLNRTQASNQAVLSNVMVFCLVIINFIIYRRTPARMFIVGLIVGIVGVLMVIISPDLSFSSTTLAGDLGTIVTYILWAGYTVFMAHLNKQTNPLISTLSIFLCGLFLLTPIFFIIGGFGEIQQMTSFNWVISIYLGIFCSAGAFYLYNLALSNKQIHSEYIAVFSLLNPLIGVFVSVLVFHEIIGLKEGIGMALILAGMLIANLFGTQKVEKIN